MLEKPSVFGSDECTDDVCRQFVERDENAAPLSNLGDQAAIAAKDPQWYL